MKRVFGMLKNNLFLKVCAVFFAFVLWSYVMAVDDPARSKKIEDVPITIQNQEKLANADLLVRGDTTEIFENVEVEVSVRLSSYSKVNAENIVVTADLGAISSPGKYTINLRAATTSTDLGEVVAVKPQSIEIEVDEKASKSIPIVAQLDGELADGLFHKDVKVTAGGDDEIEITGPKQDIERAAKAICTIDLSTVTESVDASYTLSVVDENNEVIPAYSFVEKIPSARVEMQVLHTKEVPINDSVASVVSDSARLPEGYEITSVEFSQKTVEIAGTEDTLEHVESIDVVPISVRGENTDIEAIVELKLPEGTELTQPSQEIKVTIKISQAANDAATLSQWLDDMI